MPYNAAGRWVESSAQSSAAIEARAAYEAEVMARARAAAAARAAAGTGVSVSPSAPVAPVAPVSPAGPATIGGKMAAKIPTFMQGAYGAGSAVKAGGGVVAKFIPGAGQAYAVGSEGFDIANQYQDTATTGVDILTRGAESTSRLAMMGAGAGIGSVAGPLGALAGGALGYALPGAAFAARDYFRGDTAGRVPGYGATPEPVVAPIPNVVPVAVPSAVPKVVDPTVLSEDIARGQRNLQTTAGLTSVGDGSTVRTLRGQGAIDATNMYLNPNKPASSWDQPAQGTGYIAMGGVTKKVTSPLTEPPIVAERVAEGNRIAEQNRRQLAEITAADDKEKQDQQFADVYQQAMGGKTARGRANATQLFGALLQNRASMTAAAGTLSAQQQESVRKAQADVTKAQIEWFTARQNGREKEASALQKELLIRLGALHTAQGGSVTESAAITAGRPIAPEKPIVPPNLQPITPDPKNPIGVVFDPRTRTLQSVPIKPAVQVVSPAFFEQMKKKYPDRKPAQIAADLKASGQDISQLKY